MLTTYQSKVAMFLLIAVLLSRFSIAEDFRIESEIFISKSEKEPFARNLTLFKGSVVYDFMKTEPYEITIYDPQRDRIILLDVTRKLKTELKLWQLKNIIEELRKKSGSKLAALVWPQLSKSYDVKTGWLTLSGPMITYRAKGIEASHDHVAERFRQFADWNARLNAACLVGLPPFARIELNKAMAELGVIPERVELSVGPKKPLLKKNVEIHSQHSIIWKLSKTDQDRILRVRDYQANFRSVLFSRYIENKLSAK